MKKTHKIPFLLLISGMAVAAPALHAQVFSDIFDSNTSASWTSVFFSTNVTVDFTAQFAFDYGTNQFVRNGVTNTIPSAPNSSGTTKGLKVAVNKDATGAAAAVSFFPNGRNFSGNYSLKFDMWANYNGPAYGGSESTEFVSFGLNHVGDKANYQSNSVSDGVWMIAATEAGSSPDYRAFVGPGGAPGDLGESAFFDRDADTFKEINATAQQSTNHPLKLIFPSPAFESAGAPGKQWVQAEVRQIDGIVTWLMNGYVIGETDQGAAGGTTGNISIGYMDPFPGIPSPKEDSFIIFDNVRVFTNPAPVIVTAANNGDASEPSTAGKIRISRTGSTAQALPVPYRVVGNAKSGVDFTPLSGTATIPIGASFVDVTITPINDTFAEPVEQVTIALTSGATYDVGSAMMGSVGINDDGDTVPVFTINPLRPAYELSQLGTHKGKVEFSVPTASGSNLQVNYTLSGTATNGVHYSSIPTSAIIPAGQTNVIVEILAINDNVVNADRTIIFTLPDSTTGTLLIKNDDLTPGTLLFSDNFDSNTSANWNLYRTKPADPATFAYDYSATANDIPVAPSTTNGTRKGLKIEVNTVAAGAASGISLSPKNQNFTGDYRLRMDVWINYNGAPMADGGSQSTEWFTAGVGTSGNQIQWYNGGTAVDGIWIGVDGDGGNGFDYRIYRGNTQITATATPGVYSQGTQRAKDAFETTTGAYAFFGGERPPLGQRTTYPDLQNTPDDPSNVANLGNAGFSWHDMVITKSGSSVTWHMDGNLIATLSTNSAVMSSNIFVGSFDASSGICPEPALQYAIVDNLRVESLAVAPATAPVITSVTKVGSNILINFTGATTDAASAFSVEAKATLSTAFAPEATAVMSQLSPGSFRATIPVNGNTRFYRIKR